MSGDNTSLHRAMTDAADTWTYSDIAEVLREAEYRNPGHSLYGEAAGRIEELASAAQFLVERLRDFDSHLTDDDTAREWFGHVTPAIARLAMLLTDQVSA